MLGILISFVSFVVSFYTCALIIKTAKGDTDYVFTLKKYFGMKGWYIGLIGPTILIFGAITAYFVIIVQSLYPLLVVFLKKVCGADLEYVDPNAGPPYWHFEEFSASWIAIVLYVVLVAISMKKDLSVFLRMGSFGAFCVTTLILFVVCYSIKSMISTEYVVEKSPANLPMKEVDEALKQYLVLFSQQYTCLGGLLCTGYFLHQCTLPILANAAEPEKNLRNVGIGYFMVFLSYAIVGTLGYIAFSGKDFDTPEH